MKNSIILFALFSLITTTTTYATPINNDKLFKTIILINGAPFLVELDNEGNVIHNYIMVSDYFNSSESHEDLISIASNEYESEIAAMNKSRLIIFNEESSLLNDTAVDNIRDLAKLYSKGLLQNINITAGQVEENDDEGTATFRIDAITQLLQDFGVREGDISANVKIYRSELPNQFVKIDLLK